MSLYWAHFKHDLVERTKLYERNLDISPPNSGFNAQQDFLIDLMHEYSCLTSSGEKNKRECLRRLEDKLMQNEGFDFPGDEKSMQIGVDIDESTLSQISQGLAKMREAQFLSHQKEINEAAYNEPWTEVEKLNLLRGIVKLGEHNWSEMCDKCNFQSFRTPNSLAFKWSQLKSLMIQDLKAIYAGTGVQLSKLDWFQAYIRKLELKSMILHPQSASQIRSGQGAQSTWYSGNQRLPYSYKRYDMDLSRKENMMREGNSLTPRSDNMGLLADRNLQEMQQLCANYNECVNHFKTSIENGTLSPGKVKQFLAAKEPAPPALKYFEVYYAARPQAPVKATENKEVNPPAPISEESKAIIDLKNPVETIVGPDVIQVKEDSQKAEKAYVNPKKMFLQKKKAQSSAEPVGPSGNKDAKI